MEICEGIVEYVEPATKLVHPSKVKVGDRIVEETYPRCMIRSGWPVAFKVLRISKEWGYFTGVRVWRFVCKDERSWMDWMPEHQSIYSDAFRMLPVEMVRIQI